MIDKGWGPFKKWEISHLSFLLKETLFRRRLYRLMWLMWKLQSLRDYFSWNNAIIKNVFRDISDEMQHECFILPALLD